MNYIRNFCIIAHIDHGKSTLADRLLEFTNTISRKEKKNQLLDSMDIERERGITIKSHPIQMEYSYNEKKYILNLIDTPGHVDFSYEVSRSISACEGALLIIDATQSIQSQTISNLYLALSKDLTIIPIINKIDLPNSNIELVKNDIIELLGCNKDDIICTSAKKGIGIKNILDSIISRIPAPKGDIKLPLQAIIFDSIYNPFRGVQTYFRIKNGTLKTGQKIKFMSTNNVYNVEEIGIFKLKNLKKKILNAGNVGYLIAGIKNPSEVKVGDTLTEVKNPAKKPIGGFKEVKPMLFAGIYPIENEKYKELRIAIEKLHLNDSSLSFTPETSYALGTGFRCGFLGMLHMEIIKERLEREYNIDVITTLPNVHYNAYLKKSSKNPLLINNPYDLPDKNQLEKIEEPYIKAYIITIAQYIGGIMQLCIEKRGVIKNQSYITNNRVELIFELPLSEIIFDFYDKLKTISKGYASFDYTHLEYRKSDMVKIDILINGKIVDALSTLVHIKNSFSIGKKICNNLSKIIPKQQFEIPIQAAIGKKIISRETIRSLRKNVISKCYGGDVTRKRKLLEKQKKGKKKMRTIGFVDIPQSAFISILKLKI
ncbi:GTP-binding protein LepA [Candidatus Karelsulcia muelleri CARI]|uniref:Elongation factor 4 n=1 Tax=Karelsulcia muelleri (strain CARI) TaxID=706194 RepID=E0TJ81_KARMC|nr:GTP-binding protein LepA [Candidatus Karelsulcia muelleri CARI]